ncbi:MAG: PAS domain-containing protein [Rikenellaceae bacterium]
MTHFDNMTCAVTICDTEAKIIYMNQKSRTTFAKYGEDLIGRNLREFHGERAWEMIKMLISENRENHYTILKNGVKKIIHQMPHYDESGMVAGLVEFSFEIPVEMPHYNR